MFWKYTLFELKFMLYNRKPLIIGIGLIMFFIFYFVHLSQTTPETIKQQKTQEVDIYNSTLDQMDYQQKDNEKAEQVYQSLLDQLSMVRYQGFYYGENQHDDYIETGLKVNEERLNVHELGNEGVPEYLIFPKEEILKENEYLTYLQEHNLPVEENSYQANQYLETAVNTLSGLLFAFILLLSGNEILVYENRHPSVMRGLPISFLKKSISKISVHFTYIIVSLVLGIVLSGWYAAHKLGAGNFKSPIVIYQNGGYEAISTTHYLLLIVLGFALITIWILALSVLMNLLFQNAFANLVVGLSIFLIPSLMMAIDVNTAIFHPFALIDIASVLSGSLAVELQNPAIDYGYAITWLIVLIIVTMLIVIAKIKLEFYDVKAIFRSIFHQKSMKKE
ncbi:hypothetical protein [Tenuibacillus multivorans]|uniref:ABC-2 family transporter protein n=1 Tax=Tenuibacillus multivorans TaxID=237069 RepID=A0A1G9YI39_9BACI|nr:hypothetical protein [Tenuibacillus multivorans]GEL78498.1 hypothetical protein TMU01_27330 [Tenuibacillus multivorans]SDN08737.1 hypothetical protein SAMN05216498_1414 [Tenuibacillus multivorans]